MSDLEEAEAWLSSSENLLESKELGRARFTVAVGQAIHAMIKANDALTMKFLKRRSSRHEDALKLFKELIAQNKIPAKYAKLREALGDAVADKSDFDYKGKEVGKDEAERRIRNARQFLSAVREILS